MEIWKNIEERPSYSVSSYGNIKSNITSLLLKPSIDRYGYQKLKLHHGPVLYRTVHRLVAIAFIPNPLNKPQVNHIDSNRINNNYLNLEWATAMENIHHYHKLNRNADVNGSKNPMSKLTTDDVWNIRYWINPSISNAELGKVFGVDPETIRQIRIGGTWRNI